MSKGVVLLDFFKALTKLQCQFFAGSIALGRGRLGDEMSVITREMR